MLVKLVGFKHRPALKECIVLREGTHDFGDPMKYCVFMSIVFNLVLFYLYFFLASYNVGLGLGLGW